MSCPRTMRKFVIQPAFPQEIFPAACLSIFIQTMALAALIGVFSSWCTKSVNQIANRSGSLPDCTRCSARRVRLCTSPPFKYNRRARPDPLGGPVDRSRGVSGWIWQTDGSALLLEETSLWEAMLPLRRSHGIVKNVKSSFNVLLLVRLSRKK